MIHHFNTSFTRNVSRVISNTNLSLNLPEAPNDLLRHNLQEDNNELQANFD